MRSEYKLRGVALPQKLGPEVEAVMVCFVVSGMLTKKKLNEAFSVLDKSWVSSTVAFLCFYLTVREM